MNSGIYLLWVNLFLLAALQAQGQVMAPADSARLMARLEQRERRFLVGHFVMSRNSVYQNMSSRTEIWINKDRAHTRSDSRRDRADKYYDRWGQYYLSNKVLDAEKVGDLSDMIGLNLVRIPGRDLLGLRNVEIYREGSDFRLEGWKGYALHVSCILDQDLSPRRESVTVDENRSRSRLDVVYSNFVNLQGIRYPETWTVSTDGNLDSVNTLKVLSFTAPKVQDIEPALNSPNLLQIADFRLGSFVEWEPQELRRAIPKGVVLNTASLLSLTKEKLKKNPVKPRFTGRELLENAKNDPGPRNPFGKPGWWIAGILVFLGAFVMSACKALNSTRSPNS